MKIYPKSLLFFAYFLGFVAVLGGSFLLGGCAPRLGSTIAKGDVKFVGEREPYRVVIKDFDRKGCLRWVEWQPWALQDIYDAKVLTNDRVDCAWISLCDGDTLATMTIFSDYGRHKFNKDILLDGSHYVRGTDPNQRTEIANR